MEVSKTNCPPLPPNYVSLADLQQRWIKQQQQKREKAEEATKPESLKVEEPNPSFKHKPTIRGNHRDRKGPKVYRLVQVSNPTPNASATVKTRSEFGSSSEKKTMKKMPEFESSEIEAPVTIGAEFDGCAQFVESSEIVAPVTIGVDSLIGGKLEVKGEKKILKKKKRKEKKKMKITPQSENEATRTMGVITDGGDQNTTNDQIGGKQKKNNKVRKQIKKQNSVPEKQNPVVNANCGGEGENEEKAGSEGSEKHSVGGRKVEIGRMFKQLSVTGSGGPRYAYGSYGSVVHRGIGIKKRGEGLVWVKKEVV